MGTASQDGNTASRLASVVLMITVGITMVIIGAIASALWSHSNLSHHPGVTQVIQTNVKELRSEINRPSITKDLATIKAQNKQILAWMREHGRTHGVPAPID